MYSLLIKLDEDLSVKKGINLLYENWDEEKDFKRKLDSISITDSLQQKT